MKEHNTYSQILGLARKNRNLALKTFIVHSAYGRLTMKESWDLLKILLTRFHLRGEDLLAAMQAHFTSDEGILLETAALLSSGELERRTKQYLQNQQKKKPLETADLITNVFDFLTQVYRLASLEFSTVSPDAQFMDQLLLPLCFPSQSPAKWYAQLLGDLERVPPHLWEQEQSLPSLQLQALSILLLPVLCTQAEKKQTMDAEKLNWIFVLPAEDLQRFIKKADAAYEARMNKVSVRLKVLLVMAACIENGLPFDWSITKNTAVPAMYTGIRKPAEIPKKKSLPPQHPKSEEAAGQTDFLQLAAEQIPDYTRQLAIAMQSLRAEEKKRMRQIYTAHFLYHKKRNMLEPYLIVARRSFLCSGPYLQNFTSKCTCMLYAILFTESKYDIRNSEICADFLASMAFWLLAFGKEKADKLQAWTAEQVQAGKIQFNRTVGSSFLELLDLNRMDDQQIRMIQSFCLLDVYVVQHTFNRTFPILFPEYDDLEEANKASIRDMETHPLTLEYCRDKIADWIMLFLACSTKDEYACLLPFCAFSRLYLLLYMKSPLVSELLAFQEAAVR